VEERLPLLKLLEKKQKKMGRSQIHGLRFLAGGCGGGFGLEAGSRAGFAERSKLARRLQPCNYKRSLITPV